MSADMSRSRREAALSHVAALSSGGPLDSRLRLTINFHPDRTAGDRPVLRQMAEDGLYYSQFVTGTGNGGLTAYPGGDRWRWESRIFGGAYDDATASERPVYGALNHRDEPIGGAPRFGSSHFRLTADAVARATFCYPDSCTEPSDFGVATRFALIEPARTGGLDALDGHIEAHIHGPVRLDRDMEALVLDASFRGTAVEAAARRLPCPVEWHPGFRLTVAELRRHPEYRGQEYVELGAGLAVDGRLDPRIIGAAARTGRHDPQALKKVWHCLARFGSPAMRATAHPGAAPPAVPERPVPTAPH
ncbi:DUF3626 domain-containing protein [Streptomyces jumonjinensis]|uniref:DUF3626 domain-containing protein n=1 Tax=Streptomyces jumonjinensis TaxID=1945 RepID=A0A646KGH9_STRJU|nr:DUF3626 domain-containing protein [Streptomyces jumonjinensis]MQT01333.1 DUF3626 domain-containing protein [Streptomyces jumonjinensis]